MKEVRINLNEMVKVKVTEYGEKVYRDHFHYMPVDTPKLKRDENGYSKFQLWEFMLIFGGSMLLCGPKVVQPLEIVYCEDDVE